MTGGSWSLVYGAFEPEQEGLREALCTLGNGFFATRGAAPEAEANDVHYPGTYVAGLYNRMTSEVSGRDVENEDLVNVPNWLPLSVRAEGGSWLHPGAMEVLEYQQELDLRRGVLLRDLRLRDAEGRTTRLRQRRLVSMRDPHLAALEVEVMPEDWSGTLEVRSALDGTVTNSGVPRYRELRGDHLEPLETAEVDGETINLLVETMNSRVLVGLGARTRVTGGTETPQKRRLEEGRGYIAQHLSIPVEAGQGITVEKVVALYTDRDHAAYEPMLEAGNWARRAGGFGWLLERHALAWEHLWRRFDISLDGNGRAQMILRLHIFHLLQTVSQHSIDLDVGVPARGLHGEAYRGHIFWDELFIFPLLNLRLSDLTRSLLLYRSRRLPEARCAAREAGLEGAMYPWQSGSNGREETQILHLNPKSGRWLPDNSRLQRHINVAVAYNVWQYWQATGDRAFLRYQGAEMLIEIARLFASMATYDQERERYVIRGVMGPDEYHEDYPGEEGRGLDNNAYTNVMAAWVLTRALDVLKVLPEYHVREVRELLGVRDEELERWEEVSRRLFVPFHDGVISQFEGYEDLAEFDWEGYRHQYGDIQRLDRILEAEGDSPNHYKLSKQADVLMLFYLLSAEELGDLFERLGYPFEPEEDIERNVQYYMFRTSHGSTLSRVVHSSVLARTNRPHSWELFLEALESDVSDIQGGTTAEGIHLGAMAGTVDLLQRRYGGVSLYQDTLWLDPALPDELSSLGFAVHYRAHRIRVDIDRERVRVESQPGPAPPINVAVRGKVSELAAGASLEAPL